MTQPIDSLTFKSPINLESSFGTQNLSENATSVMDLYFYKDTTGYIEWIIEELDRVENIGLEFEFDVKGKRTLVDYDGVFSLPDEAMILLERNGVDVTEMRKSLSDIEV